MKLTVIRLLVLEAQDKIDLGKIWSENTEVLLKTGVNECLYAAKFNGRLLGAVRVTINPPQGTLTALNIRESTRRRGVGQYLVEEVMRAHPEITHWNVSTAGVTDRDSMQAFMQASGFHRQGEDWDKHNEAQ